MLEAATKGACDRAVLPNGAACAWDSSADRCACAQPTCATRQPTCQTDEHCEDDCAFPCECAAGHCYLVDECWRFDGDACGKSMWNGVACCAGHGTGSDKGCFLCEPVTACKKEAPAGGGAAAVLRVKVGPFGGAVERLETR